MPDAGADGGYSLRASHHESGPGQNEIDFRYSDPLTAADNAITFQAVVRMVAAQNGLCASFMPKPLPDWDGSGMHINISAKGDGEGICCLPLWQEFWKNVRRSHCF